MFSFEDKILIKTCGNVKDFCQKTPKSISHQEFEKRTLDDFLRNLLFLVLPVSMETQLG